MRRKFFSVVFLSVFFAVINNIYGAEDNYQGKKILYVNSYHPGYYWSDGEQEGAESVLDNTAVEFRVVYMDAKNNPSPESLREAGLKVKQYIQEFKPDVVITADDDAFIYVVKDYYKDADLPVVFCGINWDISVYGAPYKNTTGIIEVGLIRQIYSHLRKFAKGDIIGVIAFDVPAERKNVQYFDRYIKSEDIRQIFVKDFASWKKQFLELQEKVDMIIFAAPEGIKNWDKEEAARFIYEHVRVPIGAGQRDVMPFALIGVSKVPQEQGEYAARIALRILDGEKPSEIPIATNKKGYLYLNLKMAGKLNIVFTPSMLKSANEIIGLEQ
jgi:ABC-type uncharacterized transport system substrate-binding protein